MSLGLLLAVLGAAFLHASWNAAVKVGASKVGMMLVVSIAEVAIGLAVALLRPPVAPAAWPWIARGVLTHLAYKSFLTFAYERGDLSPRLPHRPGGGADGGGAGGRRHARRRGVARTSTSASPSSAAASC